MLHHPSLHKDSGEDMARTGTQGQQGCRSAARSSALTTGLRGATRVSELITSDQRNGSTGLCEYIYLHRADNCCFIKIALVSSSFAQN